MRELYPLPNLPTADDYVQALRDILAKPGIDRIVIVPGRPIEVSWRKSEGDSLLPEHQDVGPDDLLGRIDIEEIVAANQDAAQKALSEAMMMVQAKGLHPSYIAVGRKTLLRRWYGILPNYPLHNHLLGARVVIENKWEPYILLVLGTAIKGGRLADARFGVKITMEVEDE